jgi:hypothetical protein
MNDFDIDAYLASRISADNKLESLRVASEEKRLGLQKRQEETATAEQARADSWAGRLGLDSDTFFGNRVNDAASLVTGVGRLAGQIASLPDNLSAAAALSQANQQEIDAWNRQRTGNALPGDQELLGRRPSTPYSATVGEQLQLAQERGQRGRDIFRFFDTSSIVDPTNRNVLAQDIGQDFGQAWGQVTGAVDKAKDGNYLDAAGSAVSGLASLLANAGSAVLRNPSGVREYIIENAPQLLVGVYGRAGQAALGASNVGYAADYFQQGLENYAKANDGQLPSQDEIQRMATLSASLALAEQGSDMAMLGAGKLLRRGAADASEEAVKRSAFKNVLRATGQGAASEFPTEAYQTYAEGEITGDPASAQDIYIGGVIGAAAGGGLTGGMRTVAEFTGATPEKAADRQKQATRVDAVRKAAATGNLDELLDPKSPTYSPADAIVALRAQALKEDVDEPAKQELVGRAVEIIDGLKSQRNDVQAQIDALSPDKVTETLEAQRQALAEIDPADTEAVQAQQKVVAMVEEALADITSPAVAKDAAKQTKVLQRKLADIDGRIESSENALGSLSVDSFKNVDTKEEASKIKADDPEGSKAAFERIFNASMAAPDSIDTKLVEQLIADEANGLDQKQRGHLRKLTLAKQAANAVKNPDRVSGEILYGAKGFTGLAQYRNTITAALVGNRISQAEAALTDLIKFEQDHSQKAALVAQAWKDFPTKGEAHVVSLGNGAWEIRPGRMKEQARRENGGVNIVKGSQGLVNSIVATGKAVTAAKDELQSAYELKVSKGSIPAAQSADSSTTTTVTPTNVSEAPEAVEGQTQGPEVPAADAAVGSAAGQPTIAAPVPGSGATAAAAGEVETAGVNAEATAVLSVSESESSNYGQRTGRNARAGDITIAYAVDHSTAGERRTQKEVAGAGKPLVKNQQGGKLSAFAEAIAKQLANVKGTVINVAGNGIYTWTNLANKTQEQVNLDMFKILRQVKELNPDFAGVVTGGQTGTDIAGAIAARALGLNVDVHMPKGFRQRKADETDITQTKEDVIRQIEEGAAKLAAVPKEDPKAFVAEKPKTETAAVDPAAPFKLNEGQQKAYDAAVAFLKSAARTFSIIGSAGTGKTTIVKTILENLGKEGLPFIAEQVILTSPTHRANAVLKSKNPNSPILTLHALLGLSPEINLETYDSKKLKFVKREIEPTMPANGLLIVDESSMINDSLFKLLIDTASEANTKIIFLGDMAQLGPVGQETDSKALLSTDEQATLTQVMRAKNAALLDESIAVREDGNFTGQQSMTQGNGVRFISSANEFIDRAIKLFSSDAFKDNPLLVRVLSYTNKRVEEYNRVIRAALHGKDAPPYVVGDVLMGYTSFGDVNESSQMYQIANGVDYIVKEVVRTRETQLFGVPVEVIELSVQDVYNLGDPVVVPVVSPRTSKETIAALGEAKLKLTKEALTSESARKRLIFEEQRLALPFNLQATDKGKTRFLANKTIDYGYAHTIHKSQGGTYTFAMLDAKSIGYARTEKDKPRLRYVGLTRAERGAFVLAQVPSSNQANEAPASNASSTEDEDTGPPVDPNIEVDPPSDTGSEFNDNFDAEEEAVDDGGARFDDEFDSEAEDILNEDAPPVEAGTLKAVLEKAAEGAEFTARKFGDFFTQSGAMRPLVAVKNFLSAWGRGQVNPLNYLELEGELSGKQQQALTMFQEKAVEWLPLITKDLKPPRDPKFNYEDPLRYLIESVEQGGKTRAEIEENVKTAIVAAIFGFIADEADKGLNNDTSINNLLGRQKENFVSDEESDLFRNAVYRQQIVSAIGSKTFDALGLKGKRDSMPLDMEVKLKNSLGSRAVKLMELPGIGILTPSSVDGKIMARLRAGYSESDVQLLTEQERTKLFQNSGRKHDFYSVSRNEKGVLTGVAREIAESMRGTGSVIPKLFSIEEATVWPSLTPNEKVQKRTDTGMGVPKTQQELFRQKQTQDAWYVSKAPFKLLSFFSEAEALEMAGVEEITEKNTHISNVKRKQSKFDGLTREFRQLIQFVGEQLTSLDQPFYLTPTAWEQQRAGLVNNAVNPQTSKIVRQLIAPREWDTVIKLDDPDLVLGFKLRMAESFGRKTEKSAEAESVAWLDKLMADGVMYEAAKIIQQTLTSDAPLTDEQKRTVIDAVKKGKTNLHAMVGLLAWAQYLDAQANGTNEFTTNLMGEVDGVSNGSMLNHAYYGAADTSDGLNEVLAQGGIYTLDSVFRQYSEYRGTEGNKDIYEYSGQRFFDMLAASMSGMSANELKIMHALWVTSMSPVTDDSNDVSNDWSTESEAYSKNGRDMAKGPINPLNYGSGMQSATANMSGNYIAGIYAQFQKFSVEEASQDVIDNYVRSLNVILKSRGAAQLLVGRPIQFYMKTPLEVAQVTALRKTHQENVGEAVAVVIKEDFRVFLGASKMAVKATGVMYAIYESVFNATRNAYIKELGIPTKPKTGEPLHDLTAKQEEELKERLKMVWPLVHSAMSQAEGNPNARLMMATTEMQRVNRPEYELEVEFATPLANGFRSMTVGGQRIQQSKPGVKVLSATTQSGDSAISTAAQTGRNVLNMHDAAGAGIGLLRETAESLNKAFWETTLNYSPLDATYEGYMRVVRGVLALHKQGAIPDAALVKIREALIEQHKANYSKDPFNEFAENLGRNLFRQAGEAKLTKFAAMSKWAVVDQYAFYGGAYTVTQEDRDEATKRLQQVRRTMSPQDQSALDEFTALVFSKAPRRAAPPAEAKAEPKATPSKSFGKQGEARLKSDPELVAFFEANPDASFTEVVTLLREKGELNGYYEKLLSMLSRTLAKVNPNVRIRYITPETGPDTVLDAPKMPSVGWYVSQGKRSEIYLLGQGYVNSGLTPQVLLHEMIHASLTQIIEMARIKKNDASYNNARRVIAELRELREGALAVASEARLLQKYAAAFDIGADPEKKDPLHEFITWGMTNPGFQKDVLNKVVVPAERVVNLLSNPIVSGMDRFIMKLVELFGSLLSSKEKEGAQQGMGILIAAVSGLMSEAVVKEAEATPAPTINANLSMAAVEAVDNYTTQEIFQALGSGSVSAGFGDQLSQLLDGIVDKLHGPFGAFAASMRRTEAGNPMAVWLKTLETGQAPFASQAIFSGVSQSPQEDFVTAQVEATVRAALESKDTSTRSVYRELEKLYREARERLTPADFASQQDYDFFFKMETQQGNRSDYLARFAALGLANEKINAALRFPTKRDRSSLLKGKTIADKLMHAFDKILSFFAEQMTRTFGGQAADVKLSLLVSQLVDIEARKRHVLQKQAAKGTNQVIDIEGGIKTLAEAARNKVVDLTNSSMIKDNSWMLVRGAGSIARVVASDQVDAFMDAIKKLRDQQFNERTGFMASMLTEIRGHNEMLQALLRGSKRLEGQRKEIKTQNAKLALKMMKDGDTMSKERKAGITATFLRTGLHNLLGMFDMAGIEKLIGDDAAIDAEIVKLKAQLPAEFADAYEEKANALGFYKAQGLPFIKDLMFNAHMIARVVSPFTKKKPDPAVAMAAEPVIAVMASLYALKYTGALDLAEAKQAIRDENNRTDAANGIEFLLGLHKKLEEEALERLFNGNPMLMVHGYTPEIYNPHTSIKVANEEEGQALVDQGYEKKYEVPPDPADPDKTPRFIYKQKDGGLAPWLSSILSLTSMQSKGSEQHSGYMNLSTQDGLANAALQAEINTAKAKMKSSGGASNRDFRGDRQTHMAPIYDDMGRVVNWRYLMAETSKNDLLDRDNRFEEIIGAFASSIFDKETSAEHNEKVIRALLDQYQDDYLLNRESYILVGPKTKDPEMRELWDLLPDSTRQNIRNVWGREGMWVRKDSVDIVFGYRKFSLADMFRKDPEMWNKVERKIVPLVEHFMYDYARFRGMDEEEARRYTKRAALYITRGERALQEIVRETKDIIVVKSGVVLVGNILSNLSLLTIRGVPVIKGLQDQLVAMRGAMSYQRDNNRLAELETLIELGMTQGKSKEIQREIVRLRDAIDRNPVKALIDAGLMPTIVEDVAADDDPYSYKSEFVRKTEKYADKLNPVVKTAARNIYMARDTWMYQTLSRTTQLSDFVARYALYQHLTTRGNEPLSHEEAVQDASETFVNYDIPMHRSLQYTDDMGITMFSKYFLRVQRVLLKATKEQPARVLGAALLGNYFNTTNLVLDSSFIHRIGNVPFAPGALQYVGAVDELATVEAAMKLIK